MSHGISFHDQSRASLASRERRAFVWRRLHSLTGVLPVGVYLVFHFWVMAKATQGRQAFDDAITDLYRIPFWSLIEVFGLAIPLVYHALYGLLLTAEARPDVARYPSASNWSYLLQRVTGAVVLVFGVWHLWQFRFRLAWGTIERDDLFPELCASLSSTAGPGVPVVAILYLGGLAASCYHLCNGLHGFCFTWGITLSRRSVQLVAGLAGLLGLALFTLGASSILYFATGSRLVLGGEWFPRGDADSVSCATLAEAEQLRERERSAVPPELLGRGMVRSSAGRGLP